MTRVVPISLEEANELVRAMRERIARACGTTCAVPVFPAGSTAG